MGIRVGPFFHTFIFFIWVTGVLGAAFLSPVALALPDKPDATGAEARAIQIQEEWSTLLLSIETQVAALKKELAAAGVQYDTSDFDRLWLKIGPQAKLKHRPLIFAFLGQHNSGKSTLLNLLIGARGKDRVTEVSDEGGSTKIPVALLPPSFPEKDLSLLFGGFHLKKLVRAGDATAKVAGKEAQLLWAKHHLVPPSIALVDTPDVDSGHRENADQTKAMIDVADVVAVMVTDQYKNHDVMELLVEIARAKKPVILIFNKVNLDHHTKLWPKRVEFLRTATGIDILDCFVIEDNPELAEAGELLDFYRIGPTGKEKPTVRPPIQAVHDLDVTRIRIQTELGALQEALGSETGLEAFVKNVTETSHSLSKLSELFSATAKSAPTNVKWPSMPGGLVGKAILDVWASHHRGRTTMIMRALPYWLKKGFGAVMQLRYQAQIDAAEKKYRQQEFEFLRDHVVALVLRELKQLRDSGKIRGRLADVVQSKMDPELVSQMQAKLQQKHEHMRLVDAELNESIKLELNRLKQENPTAYGWMQNADTVLSAFEVFAPVAMGITASQLLAGPLASSFATSLVAAPAQTTAMVATWGSTTPATAAAGDGARGALLRQPFENIVRQYANYRIAWVMEWLRENYLSDFYDELQKTSAATGSVQVSTLQHAISCAKQLGSRVIGTVAPVKK